MKKNPSKGSEVAAHMSFDIIRYAQLWEDSAILNRALEVKDSDRVLSISSAGCNVLSLLLRRPEVIIATDLNPVQNGILALKLAAIKELSHQDLVELVGIVPSTRRLELLDRLHDEQWLALTAFWPEHRQQIEKGLPTQGRLDQFLAHFAKEVIAKLPGIEGFRECFLSLRLDLQKKLVPMFHDPAFKAKFLHTFNQKMLENGRDPAQFRYVEQSNIGEYFYRRFIESFSERPLYANPYMYFCLFGEPIDFRLGYDYARPENFATLQQLAGRVKIHTAAIESLLDHPDCARVDKANLSNIFEYMSVENMNQILIQLSERMPRGGRVAFWNLLVDRTLTPPLEPYFKKVDLGPHTVDRMWFYKAFQVLERI